MCPLRSGSDPQFQFESLPGLSGEVWPAHPRRLPDELLSFWLLRTAHANRIKLQTFTSITFGRTAQIWNRDVDRSVKPAHLSVLSQRLATPVEEILGGTLIAYEGTLFERHNPLGHTPWIMPLGVYHRTRRLYGMQFCPLCLFFDRVPYYRRHWRLALATVCPEHGTLLHDRCHVCGSPVAIFRNDTGKRKQAQFNQFTLCGNCGADFRRAPTAHPQYGGWEEAIGARNLVLFLQEGWGVTRTQFIDYGPLFFPVLHRLCELLASASRSERISKLRSLVSEGLGIDQPSGSSSPNARVEYERLPVDTRHRVLVGALWLLEQWPDRLIDALDRAGLTRSRVQADHPRLPYWFDSVLQSSLRGTPYSPNVAEVSNVIALQSREGPASKARIAARLGRRSARAILDCVPAVPRRRMSDDERKAFFHALDLAIEAAPASGNRKALLQRDRLFFLVYAEAIQTTAQLLELTIRDIECFRSESQGWLPGPILHRKLLWEFVSTAWPALAHRQALPSDLIFIGPMGLPIRPPAIHARFRIALRIAGLSAIRVAIQSLKQV